MYYNKYILNGIWALTGFLGSLGTVLNGLDTGLVLGASLELSLAVSQDTLFDVTTGNMGNQNS